VRSRWKALRYSEAPDPVERVRRVRPIVGRCVNAIAQHPAPDGKLKIGVREFTLDVSPGSAGIAISQERGLSVASYWGYRLLEALAVQAKGFADLSRLRNDPLSGRAARTLRQELVRTARWEGARGRAGGRDRGAWKHPAAGHGAEPHGLEAAPGGAWLCWSRR